MLIPALLGFLLLAQAAPSAQGPEYFFVGRTESRGTVSIALSGRHAVSDRSTGRIERGNTLVLEQRLEEEGKPARNRTWRLTRAGDNRITGTISDARGPVTGEVRGNVIHLRYQSAEGPGVEQWITMDPNGRLARNRMVFRRIGITLATVESVIWRAR
jgi:hypothetical protein